MRQFDVKYLKNEYGLSCIENYILYLLAQTNGIWQQIFVESYIRFSEIFECLNCGQTYSYFKGIPRLQETGQNLGMLKMKLYKNKNFAPEVVKNVFFVMQVSEEFVKNTFGKQLWRNDHYMLLKHQGGEIFEYLNDIPASVGIIDLKEINGIYRNNIIVIEVCEKFQFEYKKIIVKCIEKIESKNNCYIYNNKQIPLDKLRDIIGIMKVIVKRMEAFVQTLNTSFNTSEYYNFLSNAYIRIKYLRLKKKESESGFKVIEEIEKRNKYFEYELIKELKKYI